MRRDLRPPSLQNSHKSLKPSIQKMIRFVEKELVLIEKSIRKIVDSIQKMKEQSAIMQQVSGVGENTAWNILAYLREITEVNRNELVALAGLAPFNEDSGLKSKKPAYLAISTAGCWPLSE